MVELSDQGDLMNRFLAIPAPKMFMYGQQNASLSYLEHLSAHGVEVAEIRILCRPRSELPAAVPSKANVRKADHPFPLAVVATTLVSVAMHHHSSRGRNIMRHTTSNPTSSTGERRVVANVVRGCIGNLVEWYDWFVYAAFSVFFAASFFPQSSTTAQLLSTALVFAVGFLMRPIGGYILGRYADRYGRKNALTLSVTDDGRRIAGHRCDTEFRGDRHARPGTAGDGATDPGTLRRRRIRFQRHVPVRGRDARPPRLLLELPVRVDHPGSARSRSVSRSFCCSC